MRSILDIEVRDEKFNEFLRKFNTYQDALKSQGGHWSAQGAAMKGANAQLKSLASLADEMAKNVGNASNNQDKFRKNTEKSDQSMQRLARSTHNVAKGILSATTALLKWSGIATAIGGLLGAGGLFGIDRMAASAAGKGRTAAGLGTTYGRNEAFGPAFRRYVDPDSLLGNVSSAVSSYAGRGNLAKLGITDANRDPAEVAVDVMRKLREMWQKTPANQRTSEYFNAFGADQWMDFASLRRLGESKDFEKQSRLFRQNSKYLNMAPGVAGQYQGMLDQFSVSGSHIEKTFAEGLVGLAPQLGKLSAAIDRTIGALMKSDLAKGAIDALGKGIGELAGYLNSPEFLNDMDEFLETMQKMAQAFKKLLGMIPGVDMGKSDALQFRQAERTYGLPKGSIKSFMEKSFSGFTPAGDMGDWANYFASVMKNPKSFDQNKLRSEIGRFIFGTNLFGGSNYQEALTTPGIPGSGAYNYNKQRLNALDKIVVEVYNTSGGNAATSVNGTAAQ